MAAAIRSGILIVDGLDECMNQDQQDLLSLCQSLAKHVRIIIVSRDEHQIRSGVQKTAKRNPFSHVRITVDQDIQSIANFISKGVKDLLDVHDQGAHIAEKKTFIAKQL